MELHLKIIGVLLIILAFIHIGFPGYFKWKQELNTLSIMNRQMMYIHSFFIAFTIFLMGVLCLSCTEDLLGTKLGKQISLGLGIFWSVRLTIQFIGYSSTIWRGRPFETTVHVFFALFWTYLSWAFITIYVE